MKLLVVLQNAYDKGQLADGFNPSVWRREFESSRTGTRLREAFPERDCAVHYANASPVVGNGPDSRHEADPAHLRRALRRVGPDVVVACGKIAEAALVELWTGDFLAIPHPASRVLTNALLHECRQCLAVHSLLRRSTTVSLPAFYEPLRESFRAALRQGRGSVELVSL